MAPDINSLKKGQLLEVKYGGKGHAFKIEGIQVQQINFEGGSSGIITDKGLALKVKISVEGIEFDSDKGPFKLSDVEVITTDGKKLTLEKLLQAKPEPVKLKIEPAHAPAEAKKQPVVAKPEAPAPKKTETAAAKKQEPAPLKKTEPKPEPKPGAEVKKKEEALKVPAAPAPKPKEQENALQATEAQSASVGDAGKTKIPTWALAKDELKALTQEDLLARQKAEAGYYSAYLGKLNRDEISNGKAVLKFGPKGSTTNFISSLNDAQRAWLAENQANAAEKLNKILAIWGSGSKGFEKFKNYIEGEAGKKINTVTS